MSKLRIKGALLHTAVLLALPCYVNANVSGLSAAALYQQKVDNWVATKVVELANTDCSNDMSIDTACNDVTVKFSDGEFDATKLDDKQTILIMDTHLEFSSVLRYRSRIKAALRQMESGSYEKNHINGYDPSFTVPKVVRDTLKEIDLFTNDNNETEFVPALWLKELYSTFQTVYSYDNYYQYIGHGNTPLLYLLEHNPKAELVIAPFPDFFGKRADLFCFPQSTEAGQTSTNLQRLNAVVTEAADNFKREMITGLGIDYINFSGGYTLETLQTDWQNQCNNALPDHNTQKALLDTMRPFYQVLFNSDGVFAFQATDVNMDADNNALDIDTSFVNRMLVGDFTTLASNLPDDGVIVDTPPSLESNRSNSKKWIDVFVNFGIGLSRPFPYNESPVMETDPLGLDSYPITSMQPSWAAPVALSRAIHIKNTEFPGEDLSYVIDDIKEKMIPADCYYSWSDWRWREYRGSCKMQDPLKHRQHEVYRLNYLP
ncbi:hypothetical protein [Thalassomonas haliotis]|uniref:Uncharacterized protein n=1 Tax=Thalassomonas haliotis TaxID=485448 RepID=A0ABY7VAA9_9GAMM|nr:hypothetical protein [Thalassomonas haliotis]WDE10550.1 hypothetical protein H3N35_20130 [Thalassomonas haliotis]